MRLLWLTLIFFIGSEISAQPLSYYLPKEFSYDSSIPVPSKIIGHEVGEWHVTHDRLVQYMRAIDQASDRAILIETGKTYEGRPQLLLIFTSPENHKNLEKIRQEHVKLSDPSQSATLNTSDMPAVLWIGCSIHGNEPSGANASMLGAYHLAAAKGPQMDSLLRNTVILLDPSFNPDGLNRFASWVNTNKSFTSVTDPNAREFNEMWPGGRTNHYWFDLNRDWMPAQHNESQNRLVYYHQWKPNVLTDHHEMGTNASFFFQPGVPSRVNPNTPVKNQELTGKIANYHARYLDKIGSLYFTKEGYDDFYYGKGSTYPDINGSIGILFEQASSRGHAQESINGLLTFPFTIRNQFTTMLSTLEAVRNMRKDLLDYQREFYVNAKKEAQASGVKAYVFGDSYDASRNQELIKILLRHQIEVYPLKNAISANGIGFNPGSAYAIPLDQPQYKLIKGIFEKSLMFKDSLFYDISAWALPSAFNLPFAELSSWNSSNAGEKISAVSTQKNSLAQSDYAYAIEWDDYYAPALLYQVQQKGIKTKVATVPFESSTTDGSRKFTYGTILIPLQSQTISPAELYSALSELQSSSPSKMYALRSGLSESGVDLGSSSFSLIKKPSVMLFSGPGTSANDVGEVWHLLDQRYKIPASLVDVSSFGQLDVSRYSVIIMSSGGYPSLNKESQDKLRDWVSNGGTLIGIEDAVNYLSNHGFTKVGYKKDSTKMDTVSVLPYASRTDARRAEEIPGTIFDAELELTHPICYGYHNQKISIFKSNAIFMDKNNSPYNTPVKFTAKPLQSGYLHKKYSAMAGNAAVINIDAIGKGRVISMSDNPNFRAFWFGTNRLMMNAIFFGEVISAR